MNKYDTCHICLSRESMEDCKSAPCSTHNSWYAIHLAEQNEKMLAMLKRAPEGCYNDSPVFWGDLNDLIKEIEEN